MINLKRLMIALCASSLVVLFLLVSVGCQHSSPRNDLLVDIAVSQGVIRFIEAGATPAEDAERRDDLIAALSVARQFVDGDTPVSSINWTDEFIQLMDWESLSVNDQILLAQLLELVRSELDMRTSDAELELYLGRVIDVAIHSAGSI